MVLGPDVNPLSAASTLFNQFIPKLTEQLLAPLLKGRAQTRQSRLIPASSIPTFTWESMRLHRIVFSSEG
jgi:hypothetical protein